MSESPSVIERLPLEHPLPDEIQTMERDDTVCKFCGVSYLIHHEVKKLEKELEKVQAELVKYKGCEEREKTLKVEAEKLRGLLSDKEKVLQHKEASIKELKANIKVKEDELWKAVQQAEAAQRLLEAEKEDSQKLRDWKRNFAQRLPLLRAAILDQKTTLGAVRSELKNHEDSIKTVSAKLVGVVKRVCKKEKDVVDGIVTRATEAEKLASTLQLQLKEAQEKAASSDVKGQRLQEVESRLQQVEKHYAELQGTEQRLQDELQKAVIDARSAKSEAQQFKELLRTKSLEVEDTHRQRAKHEQFLSNTINRLQEELRSRAEEAQSNQQELADLREKKAEQKRRAEASLNNKMEATAKEMRQLQEALESARRDCTELREEREAMVTSHQRRIEQLKESFAQRIQDAEGWPEKLNETIAKERERHAAELVSLEEKLQKAFQVDLEIQKQRNDELIQKYKQELDAAESKLKGSLQRDRETSMAKMQGLEREFAESKRLAADQEKALREEVESLKRVIAELRKQLAQGDSQNSKEVQTLKAELREAEQDLALVQQDKKNLEKRLEQGKEEILFLQETVQKECEERFELTEALGKAKEQLLVHQRGSAIASGGGGGSNSSIGTSGRSYSQLSLGSQESSQRQSPLKPTSPKTVPPVGMASSTSLRRGNSFPANQNITKTSSSWKGSGGGAGGSGGGGGVTGQGGKGGGAIGNKELKIQFKT